MEQIDNNLAHNVAKRLKELRHRRGLTQEDVRFDLEINIGRIEAGLHVVSLPTLIRLCSYYNITLSDFFAGIEAELPQSTVVSLYS